MKQFFDRLEMMADIEVCSAKGRELLVSILKSADVICSSYDLENAFSYIPSKASSWGIDARTSLAVSIGKLGQYVSASRYLLHAARRFPVFQNIKLSRVTLTTP